MAGLVQDPAAKKEYTADGGYVVSTYTHPCIKIEVGVTDVCQPLRNDSVRSLTRPHTQ